MDVDAQSLHNIEDIKPALHLPWREFLVLPILIILADITIYRNEGYSGLAAFFAITPILIVLGRVSSRIDWITLFYYILLLGLAFRMLCMGNVLQVICGVFVQGLLYIQLAGGESRVPAVFSYLCSLLFAGLIRFANYLSVIKIWKPKGFTVTLINYGFPVVVGLAFTIIFILANPDIIKLVMTNADHFIKLLDDYLQQFQHSEIVFWGAMFLIFAGILKPQLFVWNREDEFSQLDHTAQNNLSPENNQSSVYPAYRNSLFVVILLFSGYLIFEYQTLWFRTFPKGFYYAGYAHEGAFWLTVALAMATALLSIIFSRNTQQDPRVGFLKKLALVWSILNILLALAVYNRLHIYINYNGMTRMRIVGILGTTAVLIGFLLVVYKIHRQKTFSWLIHKQLWIPLIMVYLYAIVPVDRLVFGYNTFKILHGELAPSVQMSVQPIDSEGMVEILPLMDLKENIIIRQGVESLVITFYYDLKDNLNLQKSWQSYQLSQKQALHKIEQHINHQKSVFELIPEPSDSHDKRIKDFKEFVYQWY